MDSNVVRVNILGQEYVVKTSANPIYFQKIADYVNLAWHDQYFDL